LCENGISFLFFIEPDVSNNLTTTLYFFISTVMVAKMNRVMSAKHRQYRFEVGAYLNVAYILCKGVSRMKGCICLVSGKPSNCGKSEYAVSHIKSLDVICSNIFGKHGFGS
jgi:hypothetical protein